MDEKSRSDDRSMMQRLASRVPGLLFLFSVVVATVLTLHGTWGVPITGALDTIAWFFMWAIYFVFVCVSTFAVYGFMYAVYRLEEWAHSRAGLDLRKKPSERLIEWLKSKGS